MTLFAASGITCLRGGVAVLADLSVAVGPGETVVLRGANGSGKTTLLRTLAGLQPAIGGRIDGQDGCAYASHLDGVKAALTVTENLTFWADIFATDANDAVLHDFALWDLRDRPAGTLSAGQSRRLGLARLALTGRPVWLMDEPTVSLDTASVAVFAAQLRSHTDAGGAAIVASHIDMTLTPTRVLNMDDFAPASGPPQGAAAWGAEGFA